jgi:hypothetical protein
LDEREEDEAPNEAEGDGDEHLLDGLVNPDLLEITEDSDTEIELSLHSEPIQPTIIPLQKQKKKKGADFTVRTFLGEWVGPNNPLNETGRHLRVIAANFGGKIKPWGDSGQPISENRADAAKELIRMQHADMVLITEGHIDQSVASMIEEHGRVYNYRAIVAPTSTNTA